jgi:hypothetical protein
MRKIMVFMIALFTLSLTSNAPAQERKIEPVHFESRTAEEVYGPSLVPKAVSNVFQNSVVGIFANLRTKSHGGRSREADALYKAGTGFVVSDHQIFTCFHNISTQYPTINSDDLEAPELKVVVRGQEFPAELTYGDPVNDLALLRVADLPDIKFSMMPISFSDMQLMEQVPLELFSFSLAHRDGRKFFVKHSAVLGYYEAAQDNARHAKTKILMQKAPPGFSGSPVVDAHGNCSSMIIEGFEDEPKSGGVPIETILKFLQKNNVAVNVVHE